VNSNQEDAMRAVGYQNPLPIDAPAALVDIELEKPEPVGRDLLVAVRAFR
jgi:NADPH2:quinone reductase